MPTMAAGRANTPDPAISPARKMEAVMMPRPLGSSGINCSFSILDYKCGLKRDKIVIATLRSLKIRGKM